MEECRTNAVAEFVAQLWHSSTQWKFGKFLDTRNVPHTNQTTLFLVIWFGWSNSDLSQKGLEKCQKGWKLLSWTVEKSVLLQCLRLSKYPQALVYQKWAQEKKLFVFDVVVSVLQLNVSGQTTFNSLAKQLNLKSSTWHYIHGRTIYHREDNGSILSEQHYTILDTVSVGTRFPGGQYKVWHRICTIQSTLRLFCISIAL